ncbi:hypothetical protein ACF2G4_22830 (plasmid) [Pantoea sp. C3]|uniref:hypothetical protein n=1 Tax=Pantoea phytostimulans TaxID=2769024 RepID=UPI0038F7B096
MSNNLRLGVELPGEDLLRAIVEGNHLVTRYLKQINPAYLFIGGERSTTLKGVSPNPGIVAGWLSRKLTQTGFVMAASFQRDHPFNIARRVASFDHISQGRTGVAISAQDPAQALGINAQSSWTTAPLDAHAVADGMLAIRKLWRTWPRETLSADPAISAQAVVRYAHHQGVFPTSGPLNSPTTLQGEPLLFWRVPTSPYREEQRQCVAEADAVIVDFSDLETFTHWATPQLDAARQHDEPIQLHVRLPLNALKQDNLNLLDQHPDVTALVIYASSDALPDLVDHMVTIPRLRALTSYSASASSLREVLGITRHAEPNLQDNAPAFAAKNPEPA